MNQDPKPENDSGSFSPEVRARTNSRPDTPGDDKDANKSENPAVPHKQKIIQPLPDNQVAKERMVGDAHASSGADPTPGNTTTIPGAAASDEGDSSAPASTPAARPQIPAGETSKLTSYLPTREHLDAVDSTEKEAAPEKDRSSRAAKVILICLVVAAVLLGVVWFLLNTAA